MIIKRLLFFSSILLFFFSSATSYGQVDKFKAMYVYNICKFIEWPKVKRSGVFEIAVVGNTQVANAISALAKRKKIFGRPIIVKTYSSVSKVKPSHVMYVGASQTKLLPKAVVKIGKGATLIIAEKKGAINYGAAVNFLLEGKKLKFEIKHVNATRQSLKINKAINKLATKVY